MARKGVNKRTARFNCLMSAEEQKMLNQLAADDGLTASDVFRRFVRSEYNTRTLKRAMNAPAKRSRR